MRWATQAAGWQTALWRRYSSGKRRGERPASLRAAPLSSHPPEQNGPRITPRVYCVATPTAHSGASLWLSCVEHAPPFTRSVKCHCRATTTPLRPPVVDTAVADFFVIISHAPPPPRPPKPVADPGLSRVPSSTVMGWLNEILPRPTGLQIGTGLSCTAIFGYFAATRERWALTDANFPAITCRYSRR